MTAAALSLDGADAGASNGKISIFFTISSSAMFYGSEAGRGRQVSQSSDYRIFQAFCEIIA